ncbi:transglycosylase domain-containing protein [Streptomonospora litoralis]|uniref:Penicillin-binding protein 1A n=1 Tax=Streptomonospora litoralis TaxID=2498135 RepID=A0A4V0ZKE7_9ACTN|nr:transglycosylase domain-containing protein [Streptomonospora litoralis]QBI56722.1 Penicillin-binding protein 1A [Streptomonospora litoralis]
MSTERRRNAGGRRRAGGPAGGAHGDGGRRRAGGPAGDERAGGRRRPDRDDTAGYWDGGGGGGGGRGRPGPADGDGFWDDDRPARRSRPEPGDARRRRPEPGRQSGQRRAAAGGARSEAGPGGPGRRAAHGSGGRRRAARDDDHDEFDDRGPVKRFFAKAWKPAVIACSLMFITGVAVLGIAYASTPDPRTIDEQDRAMLAATSINYANGKEAVTTGEVNRVMIKEGEEIPQPVVNGVLAAEQRNFYEEPGISISGTARAVLTLGSAGGGSTITQQMARNYYDILSQERTYTRKLREIMIAIKAGQVMAPDEILKKYLNTIYFGRQAYGVQAAAQAYFGKDVQDLNAAEGVFIGSIIQQPGNFENIEKGSEMEEILKERWDYTRDGLVEMHQNNPELGMTKAKANELEFPETVPYDPGLEVQGQEGYIKTAVLNELANRYGLEPGQVQTGGYTVETSLDPKLMKEAAKAFSETLPDMPKETVQGLVSVKPQTGEIKAFYGGTDWTKDPNNSLRLDAQAGSAFKPYVLATGLEQGIGLKSEFNGDSPQEFPGVGESIQNDSNVDHGQVNLVESTADSINTSFVQLAIETTPQAVRDTAAAAGVSEDQFETAQLGPNIALGTYRVSALDQAAGFATFANGGVHMPQHMITKVTNAEGDVVEPEDAAKLESGTQAFSRQTAIDATYAMTQVVENGGGESAALPDGRPVAGKTGTSNSAKSAWFVGFTPQLSTAVGLSRDDGKKLVIPGVEAIYGGTTSAKIWKTYMTEAMKGKEVMRFEDPVYSGSAKRYGPTPTPEATPTQEEPSEEPDETITPTAPESPTQQTEDPTETATPPCRPDNFWEDCEPTTPGTPTGEPTGGEPGEGGNGNGNNGGNNEDDNDNGIQLGGF